MALEEKQFTEGLVSIVTPVYNTEEYLPDYLDSILRQTYRKLELILVDDGSEDRSAAVAKSWQGRLEEKGISCRILRTRHRNASAALGHGLPFVTGEYLIWPDSDDVLAANSIEIRVDFLKKHPEEYEKHILTYIKKKFFNYRHSYNRISEEYKMEFLRREQKEYIEELKELGDKKTKLDSWVLGEMNRIIDSPELFYYEQSLHDLKEEAEKVHAAWETLVNSKEFKNGLSWKKRLHM